MTGRRLPFHQLIPRHRRTAGRRSHKHLICMARIDSSRATSTTLMGADQLFLEKADVAQFTDTEYSYALLVISAVLGPRFLEATMDCVSRAEFDEVIARVARNRRTTVEHTIDHVVSIAPDLIADILRKAEGARALMERWFRNDPRRLENACHQSILPTEQDQIQHQRAEAHLDRRIARILGHLERLQRLRLGENLPPPTSPEAADSREGLLTGS